MSWFHFNSKKKETSNDERRRFVRLPRTFIAQCEHGNHRSFSMIFDISEGGLGALLEESLSPNTSILLTIQHEFISGTYSSEKINLSLPMKVAWVKPLNHDLEDSKLSPESEDTKFRTGLSLQTLLPETQQHFEQMLLAFKK
jgi:hypothetical protein